EAVTEPVYRVVWPLGKLIHRTFSLGQRISDFNGKTIGELSDWSFRTTEVFPIIRELLSRRYPGIKFIEYSTFGDTHGTKEREMIAALPELLHKHRCDAVISGIGG
ncbi:UGSC family (seleno)protein, partial [Chloroflexota bacterium]